MARDRPRDDNPEWTEVDFKRARPASEVVGAEAAAALTRKGGRPPKPVAERKQQVTLRMAPDLLEAMRATGKGWQARAEAVLRRAFIDAPIAELQANVPARALAREGKGAMMTLAEVAEQWAHKVGQPRAGHTETLVGTVNVGRASEIIVHGPNGRVLSKSLGAARIGPPKRAAPKKRA